MDALRIHVAHAASAPEWGVLLYPSIMGLDDNMRGFARVLAQAGLTAVVWDPYDGEDGNGGVSEMLARSRRCEDQTMVRDLTRVVDLMQDEMSLPAVAGIGWCFGGRVALIHAGRDDRVRALSVFNPTLWSPVAVRIDGLPVPLSRSDFPGQTMDEFALASSIGGPVQVSRPEHDFTGPAEYQSLIAALQERQHPTFYAYYPGADHGFSYTPGSANELAHRFSWAATLSLLSMSVR